MQQDHHLRGAAEEGVHDRIADGICVMDSTPKCTLA